MNLGLVPLSHHKKRIRQLWRRNYRDENLARAQAYFSSQNEVYELEERIEQLWSELEDVKQQRDRLYFELQEARGDTQ